MVLVQTQGRIATSGRASSRRNVRRSLIPAARRLGLLTLHPHTRCVCYGHAKAVISRGGLTVLRRGRVVAVLLIFVTLLVPIEIVGMSAAGAADCTKTLVVGARGSGETNDDYGG